MVMRIKRIITKGKMLWSFFKFSPEIPQRNVWKSVWRNCDFLRLRNLLGAKRENLGTSLPCSLEPSKNFAKIEDIVKIEVDIRQPLHSLQYAQCSFYLHFVFHLFQLCVHRLVLMGVHAQTPQSTTARVHEVTRVHCVKLVSTDFFRY